MVDQLARLSHLLGLGMQVESDLPEIEMEVGDHIGYQSLEMLLHSSILEMSNRLSNKWVKKILDV